MKQLGIDPVMVDCSTAENLCLCSLQQLKVGLREYARAHVLVLSMYRGLRAWMNCCVCANGFCTGICRQVHVLNASNLHRSLTQLALPSECSTADEEDGEDIKLMGTTHIYCVSYGLFNAQSDAFSKVKWTAVVLEYVSHVVVQPFSQTMTNILKLVCEQWYTVNLRSDKPTTRWWHFFREAHMRSRLVEQVESIYNRVEPGLPIAHDAPQDRATGRSMLNEIMKVDFPDGMTCFPPVCSKGIWYMAVTPCTHDAVMLTIAWNYLKTQSFAGGELEKMYQNVVTAYFGTAVEPLMFQQICCVICGEQKADACMACCFSMYHRTCLLNECRTHAFCPSCDTRISYQLSSITEDGSFIIVDPRDCAWSHEWSPCKKTASLIIDELLDDFDTVNVAFISPGQKATDSTPMITHTTSSLQRASSGVLGSTSTPAHSVNVWVATRDAEINLTPSSEELNLVVIPSAPNFSPPCQPLMEAEQRIFVTL